MLPPLAAPRFPAQAAPCRLARCPSPAFRALRIAARYRPGLRARNGTCGAAPFRGSIEVAGAASLSCSPLAFGRRAPVDVRPIVAHGEHVPGAADKGTVKLDDRILADREPDALVVEAFRRRRVRMLPPFLRRRL